MSEIEMKVKEKTAKLSHICDKLIDCFDAQISDIQNLDTAEATQVSAIINNLCEAKEKCVKSMYYEQIMGAMQDSEYGKDYDEDGALRGYRGRSATTGRYVHRAYTEMRDMDKDMGRMYYSVDSPQSQRISGNNSRGYVDNMRGYDDGYNKGYRDGKMSNETRMMQAKRGYEESKDKKGETAHIERREKLQHLMDTLEDELTPYGSEMDSTEKSIVRNGLQKMINKFA